MRKTQNHHNCQFSPLEIQLQKHSLFRGYLVLICQIFEQQMVILAWHISVLLLSLTVNGLTVEHQV